MDHDIVPKPRTALHSLQNLGLYFGCKTGKEELSYFWCSDNVSVDFGIRIQKVICLLKYDEVEYKLELSYENIWQTELYSPRGHTAKKLLFQLLGAPRIFEKEADSSGQAYEDPFQNYCRETPDDQWIRTTDFTPSCAIGQSSVLCLELPYGLQLPDFGENFPGYKGIVRDLVTELCPPFSCSDLGAMVCPPECVGVPYDILFKVNSLVQQGWLPGPKLGDNFFELVDARKRDLACIEYALDKLYNLRDSCYEPSMWLEEQYMKYRRLKKPPKSPLRENSMWMFASRWGLTADDIREWMGDFCHIKNVAKYAARLGQSFGSSTETLTVAKHEIEVIPDIVLDKYVFSDGIGKISADFAKKVALKCGYKGFTPSAFQIRYGGYKGVVAIDPTSSMKLSLRKSMSKYESENTKLDVLACSKYQPCFLNRQLITLLSTLEVPDLVFMKKQRAAVQQLNAILTDPLKAQDALDLMSPGETTNILKELLTCGYKPDVEPFLSMMLQIFRASKLLDLRLKTRIFIPDGRAMMGCLDETGTLEYGEVFVQLSGNRHPGSASNHIEGKVVVAKNPCLHPGDVRVLKAVNVPELHHMVDCVVFPQKGSR
ncbi:hypothetical protein C1H46_043543 [Malus baccata]|uniref:RNA-dependent RNA polymerase n=1 Tax=Malus baccata TaxID=106549 RepID=A0A540K9M6_MALBA|nr:hypothetical protein C1H46_043543 [Malus baccata]